MAAATQVQTVNITINDIEIAVPKGELIVESVKRLGLEIPIFCYHARMKPVGMCRMCLIEVGFKQPDGSVRKMPKPQAGCTLPASDGMVIYTDTELVHRDRKGVLEFLLINHPLDCPICDRGGECPLQNNTLFYGPSTSRFVELKRHLPKAYPLSQYVTLDLERCIQCGRCVRFTEEISGDSQLAFRFRGASMQPSTFELKNFESKFSGNVIEICPVGALTSSKYRFRARPWDLETKPAICTICSNGCNIWFDYRAGKMVRINGRTHEGINEEWTCDRGKFGHEFYNSDRRLKTPFVRRNDALKESSWSEAYSEILREFTEADGSEEAALVGCGLSNEDYAMLQRLFQRDFQSINVDYRFEKHLLAPSERLEKKLGVQTIQNSIASLESEKAILVFGTSLADELPIVFLRVRKSHMLNGTSVIVAHDEPTDADSFADLVLRYRPGTASALASGLLAELVRNGKAQVPAPTQEVLTIYTLDHTEQVTGVPADQIRLAAEKIAGAAILTSNGLYDVDGGPGAVEALAGIAMTSGGKFNGFARKSNEEGAHRILPAEGLNTHQILEAAADGKLKLLWLVGVDPFVVHHDRELVQRALENVEFLVVQDIAETEAMHYASVVLPQTAPAEMEGTFTNVEGRVQRMMPVLAPKGQAKPAWRIFSEMSLRIRPETPFFNPTEVRKRLATEVADFSAVDELALAGPGSVLPG
jgi:NADH-quinone oxidoreductase subunit G